ncbi:MAG: sigma-70 family RNA polymerase sigma factor [Bacteroidota bacterium]
MTLKSGELIRLVKEGDTEAIKPFYLSEKSGFKTWLSSKFEVQGEEINDLYQESMIILLENIRKGLLDQMSSELKTYLYAIGKHLVYNRYKQKRKNADHLDALREHLVFHLDQGNDPEREQWSKMMATVVEGLLEPCKSILLLFYYQNLKASQISRQLGYKNEGVVRNQKKRCIDSLKHRLNGIQGRAN